MPLPRNTLRQLAQFETTRRLVAALVNEGMIAANVSARGERAFLNLRPKTRLENGHTELHVPFNLQEVQKWIKTTTSKPLLHPNDLASPVYVSGKPERRDGNGIESDPQVLWDLMLPWFMDENMEDEAGKQISQELRSSADNQEEWFKLTKTNDLTLHSGTIEWEQAILKGHPTHPMHRSCLAQASVQPIPSHEIPTLLTPSLQFLALPSSTLRITGPFTTLLQPLLRTLSVRNPYPNTLILPCLSRQIPAILQICPSAHHLSCTPTQAQAQASIRTVSLPASLNYPYHLKLSLACKITSALRTITPWTACIGPEVGDLLVNVLPEDLWVCKEVASITGSSHDFDTAKHLSCVLREDLEPRAATLNETLIPAGALAETDVQTGSICHAERVFGLDTLDKRKEWLRTYAAVLLRLVLQPALEYGIALEAHGQNMLLRVDKSTGEVKGFAVRDFGGIRIHMPTLHGKGYQLLSALPGSFTTTNEREEVWDILHHTIFNNHLNHLVQSLGLHREGGWTVVREELDRAIEMIGAGPMEELRAFLTRDTVHLKAFLKMKMSGLYRDYLHSDVQNILLS